ncbi:SDR family NAD(P)-dependent oxidoreductase [Streptomyces sedi]|uniref:SDR family NAD(P)-dependent oxidoreductase n=1 Tax=Streptomyces sedi TaxID=555059 RepID=A0A5C4UQG4_9ACTN|nr:SDR family NAD(P)-dependent oxidoreductase [Streptomyces sedi]TNM25850.1 SDR family NAD(P)-dependent oxidoreductase [Streptomyces sedi]
MRTIVITGSSSGIGAAAAIRLAGQGKQVVITGRSAAKLAEVHRAMAAAAPEEARIPEPLVEDLSSLDGVRRLADRLLEHFPRLDVLVNNAAVQPSRRRESADGFELSLAVNHLAPFLLTRLLSARLLENAGRVVTTASDSHAKGRFDFDDIPLLDGWTGALSYGRSKLANILFTAELQRRTPLPATCFHPGAIRTDINRDSPFVRLVKPFERFVLAPPERGADTLVWLATSDEGGDPRAVYYQDRAPAETDAGGDDPELAARLWEVSAELTRTHSQWPMA